MKQIAPYSVIYEDANVIAVNKASGLSVGGERWDTSGERLDKMLAARQAGRIFVVHRIDKETSGVVVFAKNPEAHTLLNRMFEQRVVDKRYIAVVNGKPAWRETLCELYLVPDGNKKHQTIIDRYRGKKSRTRFKLLCAAGNYTILEAIPETGRTHQIRVSLAHLRHPVVCDELYGSAKPLLLSSVKSGWRGDRYAERPLLSRLALHAARLCIPGLPPLETPLCLEAPPPKDIKAALHQFEKTGETYE